MAGKIIRRSPVTFDSAPAQTEERDNWTVVLEFENQGAGPWIVDLSHRARWDLQDRAIEDIQPWGASVPDTPGRCNFANGILINRMNRTQASLWHLKGDQVDSPEGQSFTDVTDSTVFLALIGKNLSFLLEKLTALDFFNPLNNPPFLLQGPLCHVPCQCVMLEKSPDRSGILFTCSRGYAQSMVEGILEAGTEFGIRPAGEDTFNRWLMDLQI
ncbi:MAG: sarcosine oxidase subunit gamma SoxG [Desulfobacterales bacterium]|nr:MAG: sarcosine oxidase subunit gamma SoxG [Desulfobacterales bacterium]